MIQVLLCLILFSITSCGEFNYSPYISKTSNVKHNDNALAYIAERESKFSNSFKVAIFSDTHDYYEELDEIIAYINAHQDEYAFAIVMGDITNIGLLKEFKTARKFLSKLKIPYITTIGNHDLLTNGGYIYEQLFGKETYSLDFKQTKFILYNNNNWESFYKVPNMSWIDDQLTSSGQTHQILLAHVAIDDDVRFSSSIIDQFKTLIDSNRVKYSINGHNHNHSEGTFANAVEITVGSSSKGTFCELIINDSAVTHAFIHI